MYRLNLPNKGIAFAQLTFLSITGTENEHNILKSFYACNNPFMVYAISNSFLTLVY